MPCHRIAFSFFPKHQSASNENGRQARHAARGVQVGMGRGMREKCVRNGVPKTGSKFPRTLLDLPRLARQHCRVWIVPEPPQEVMVQSLSWILFMFSSHHIVVDMGSFSGVRRGKSLGSVWPETRIFQQNSLQGERNIKINGRNKLPVPTFSAVGRRSGSSCSMVSMNGTADLMLETTRETKPKTKCEVAQNHPKYTG